MEERSGEVGEVGVKSDECGMKGVRIEREVRSDEEGDEVSTHRASEGQTNRARCRQTANRMRPSGETDGQMKRRGDMRNIGFANQDMCIELQLVPAACLAPHCTLVASTHSCLAPFAAEPHSSPSLRSPTSSRPSF